MTGIYAENFAGWQENQKWSGWYKSANSFCNILRNRHDIEDEDIWEYIWALQVAHLAGVRKLDEEMKANYVDHLGSRKVQEKIRKGRAIVAAGATIPDGIKKYFPFEFEK